MSWRGWGAQGAPRPLCSLPLSLPHCSYSPAHGHTDKAQAGFHRGPPYPTRPCTQDEEDSFREEFLPTCIFLLLLQVGIFTEQ